MCLCALTWSSARPVARNASNWARISAASWRRMPGAKKKRKPARDLISVEADRLPRPARPSLRGGSIGAPSTRTRCSPTRSPGRRRARATASAAAGAATIRLGGRQDAVAVRLLDRLVDRDVAPEIVGADDQPARIARERVPEPIRGHRSHAAMSRSQPAISRWRRNWKNSTPSRSRRRIICGLAHHLGRRARRSCGGGSRSAGRRSRPSGRSRCGSRCG